MTRDHDTGDEQRPQPTEDGTQTFVNPLPGDEEIWKDTTLGPPGEWPTTLQSFSTIISAFVYPAALFWGEQLVLVPNEAWTELSSITGPGQVQRGKLSADLWHALQSAMMGGQPRRVQGGQLLRADVSAVHSYTVLLSPLFGPSHENCLGVLAQVIPESSKSGGDDMSNTETRSSTAIHKTTSEPSNLAHLDDPTENIPLDEHPFFHRFAEMLPTGLAILDHRANAIFVNQRFHELTTHRDDDKSFLAWPHSIHDDDYDRVMNAYQEALLSQKELRTEFRSLGEDALWRLLLLTPLGDENLQHVSLREYGGFLCSIVDINSEKRAELSERKAAKEAKERREQQERFIDMISHEIRNPLSAILHCTEDVEVAIQNGPSNVDIKSICEAVETINLCISHQRNIVDDVLSFSKLDASMLSLAPKPCEPSRQIRDALKMFQPELRKQNVKFDYVLDTSYIDCAVSWAMADMARIAQILVNLVTNAIKFTARKEGEKKVVVSVGASRERPTSWPPSVVFFNADDGAYRMDSTSTVEWGNGEALFILVAVKDTGIGISRENQKRLFERFRQATPKTEEVYGGSGLGLSIARKMCHLHGGKIGVASEEGSGSTFGFFFRVRRADSAQGSAESDERETDERASVKNQIETFGMVSPNELDREMIPQSLEEPPVTGGTDSAPKEQHDSRYEETAEVAGHVEDAKSDPYANSERPKISSVHRSGEFWQSNEVSNSKAASNVSQATDKQTSEQEVQVQSGSSEKDTQRKPHILLAEDNIVNQRIVFRKLESQGYNVTTANNGREAVEAIRNAPKLSSGAKAAFDMVLMDQEMPVMDGNAATREIRKLEKDGELENIPILGVTANVRDDQRNDMVANGMDDIISKPYKIDELVGMVEKLLRR